MNPVLEVGLWMIPIEIISSSIATELARRYRMFHCVLMWIVPFLLSPYWFLYTLDLNDWFAIAKLGSITILAGCCIYSDRWLLNEDAKKKWQAGQFEWWRRVITMFSYLALALNITEAIIQDAVNHRYVNAVNGVLLLLGQGVDGEILQPPPRAPYYCVEWNLTGANKLNDHSHGHIYPIAYVLWNHTFCYGSYAQFGAFHLVSPFLLSWWYGWNLFIMYRAYALAFAMIVMLFHKNGTSWFFWDKSTFYNLYYNETYFSCLQWVALSYTTFGLLSHQYHLYRQDTKKGHENRVTSVFQLLLRTIGVKRNYKKD